MRRGRLIPLAAVCALLLLGAPTPSPAVAAVPADHVMATGLPDAGLTPGATNPAVTPATLSPLVKPAAVNALVPKFNVVLYILFVEFAVIASAAGLITSDRTTLVEQLAASVAVTVKLAVPSG